VDLAGFLAELDEWAEERDPGWGTVRYGDDAAQLVEQRGSGERVAVLVHGGFWRPAFDRSTMRALAVHLACEGWTSWNVEYRRTGLEETLADVRAALAVTGRATAIGHSAGGHLALWAAAEGLVERAVSLAGVTDLARAARERIGDGAAVEFAGADPPAHADPMRRLPLPVPALLVHGTKDDRVPVEYSRDFAATSGAELIELPRTGHFELIDPRDPAWACVEKRL
jgi:pimeloyl-ACP methyl ester carboxylesterase